MATAGELQSIQEAALPTQHQQDALTPDERRQGRADEGMDGEREELRVRRWVDDQMKRDPARRVSCLHLLFWWTTVRAPRAKLFTARSCVQKQDGETRSSIIK